MKIYGPWPWDLSIYINYLESFMGDISSPTYLFIQPFIYQYGLTDIYFILVIIQYYFVLLLKLFHLWPWELFHLALVLLWQNDMNVVFCCVCFALFFVLPHFLSLYVPGSSCVFLLLVFRSAIMPRNSGYCYCKWHKKPRSGH